MRHHLNLRKRSTFIAMACVATGLVILGMYVALAPYLGQHSAPSSLIQGASISRTSPPTPFMYRPYYGSATVPQRTTSFVDHDQPWYSNDGIFVRYDGQKWTGAGASISSCTGGVNCYDGHNGYDLNLRFESVLSAAAGTVIRAGWYDPTNHNDAYGLWAAIDHGNGFVTAYAHLSALTVYNGEQVGIQWPVGTSGTTGSSTGPHLHFATYYLPNWQPTDPFGWTGNYTDPNVVPDNYLWVSNPGANSTVPNLSANGSNVYPGASMVDDGASGWSSSGTWTADNSSTDINGNLHWVSTASGSATATAAWQAHLPASGYYEVGVFVDDNHASSSWVPYSVYSADPSNPSSQVTHNVNVDETHIGLFQGPFGPVNTGPQWVSLGTYYFNASQPGRVVMSNATGENGLQVAADGVEFAPLAQHNPTPTPTPPAPTPTPPAPTPTPPAPTPSPTPQSPIYNFSVTSDGAPHSVLVHSTTSIALTLKNTSNFSWLASGPTAVQVNYRWLNAQNQIVLTGNPTSLPQNTAVNASVSVNVAVQSPSTVGAYTLQWDLIQSGKDFSQEGARPQNDSVQVAAHFGEAFSQMQAPTIMTPGASMKLAVNVTNTSDFTWSAAGSAQVTLGYHWLNANGSPVNPALLGPASTGSLIANVMPGHSAFIPISVQNPALAGSYKLVFDMQQQGTWYSSQGAIPLTMLVNVAPNLPKVYYFAESYTGSGSSEYLSLTNPSSAQASISITYYYSNGSPLVKSYNLPALSHQVLNINQEAGQNQSFSMLVQGSEPLSAERTMYLKGVFNAATNSPGVSTLSANWYFAEANTTQGWATFLSVLNPSSQTSSLKISYLCASGPCGTSSIYILKAQARTTIGLNSAFPERQFAMIVNTSAPVAIERPEYQTTANGGSAVAGAIAPQTLWYFGAGNTTPGFYENLLLANPSSSNSASAQIRYLGANGQVVTQNVQVPAQTRIQVSVNQNLVQELHSTMIVSNYPIIAERQDFFTTQFNGTIQGSTTTDGGNAHTSWYLAQGDTTSGHAEYLALGNPSILSANVQVVYYLSSGSVIIKAYSLSATSRLTINVTSDVGVNQMVGSSVYSSQPIVVEQIMFYNTQNGSGGYTSMEYGMN